MYCPSCGSEITVELKYCNRCGANLLLTSSGNPVQMTSPIKLTIPSIVLGLTITGGLGIIFGGASELAQIQVHPAAITWIVIFSLATLFGCTALLLRFWSKVISLNRETQPQPRYERPAVQRPVPYQQLPPRLGPGASVTEHTTRTFSPAYREGSDPGAR
ncbi:MAG: hypothetical protein M3R67_03790 [Acidobacteriota bacterium]|nr:hypothetical protein [Acidobacteriota bacterium]